MSRTRMRPAFPGLAWSSLGAQASVVWALAWLGVLGGCGESKVAEPAHDSSIALAPVGDRAQLRASYVTMRQSQAAADARYQVTPSVLATLPGNAAGTRQLAGENPVQGLRLRFNGEGVRLTPKSESWQLGMLASEVVCGSTTHRLTAAQPTAGVGNHADFERFANGTKITEWYVNGPLGLEQGFTLERTPCQAATPTLGLNIEITGLAPSLAVRPDKQGENAESVELRDAEGQVIARYTDLFATDALGRALPSRLDVTGGAVRLDVDTSGAIWPVTVDPLVWVEQQKLNADDEEAYDRFGCAVALSGDTALIGAEWDDDQAANSGAAYVFVRSGASWTQQQKLTASDGAFDDSFGRSIALSGDTALVSAYKDDEKASDAGAVYVFVRSGATWTQQQKLTASDAAVDDWFGTSLALSGETALVSNAYDDDKGATSGSAYVFVRSGTTWTEQQKLTASDGAAGDLFGATLALSGDTALVGAYLDDYGGGAAYVFVRSGTVWTQQQRLVASDRWPDDYFGGALALLGDTALVGATGDDDKGPQSGSAYVFTRSGTTWAQQQKLTASDGVAQDGFGGPISVSGNRALLGASSDDDKGTDSGSAYVFVLNGSVWAEQRKLTASDGTAGDRFGGGVLSGDTALIAAGNDTDYGISSGSVYALRVALEPGDACTLDSECHALHCVENVCCDTACSGTCQTCLAGRKASGPDGACGNVAFDTDPRNACAAQSATSCGTTGLCDGAGACSKFAAGAECDPATCPSLTSQNLADSCNGSGACTVTVTTPCDPGYVCANGACKTSCASNDDCNGAQGYVCNGNACQIPQGEDCDPSDVCETGQCADGVCCDVACDETCSGCTHDLTGEPDGTCAPIPADQDPQDECQADPGYPASCGADGMCNGLSQCRAYAKLTTPCGATTCQSGAVSGLVCNGVGECEDDTVSCSPYVCAGAACGLSCASEADCDEATGYCVTGGTCAETKEAGLACQSANECSSGFCVDGVCCNSACDGQCEACGQEKAEGKCVAVFGAPVGERAACEEAPGAEPCQTRSCDGANRQECAGFAGADVSCHPATCDEEGQTAAAVCDGYGACAIADAVSCNAYRCNAQGTACAKSCDKDADCSPGNGCVGGKCGTGAACSEDGISLIDQDQNEIPCAPYKCEGSACLTECSNSTDCVGGGVCDPESHHCETTGASAGDDDGCGCRVAGRSSAPPRNLAWLALGVLALITRRSRRRPWCLNAPQI